MSAGGRSEAASRFEAPSRFEPSRSRFRDEIEEEAEYYARKNNERAYLGEAYNGATKDWAIVDVPPGTNRVKMDGIGGASQEVTWQRYNGVRRSNFIAEGEVYSREIETRREIEEPSPKGLDRGRRFVAEKPKAEAMWTEITKDLVVKEAIEAMGYEFEETEYFYYVMEYLRYVSFLHLVPPFFFFFFFFFFFLLKTLPLTHTTYRKTSSASSKSPKISNATAANAFVESSSNSVSKSPSARRNPLPLPLHLRFRLGTRKGYLRGRLYTIDRRRRQVREGERSGRGHMW